MRLFGILLWLLMGVSAQAEDVKYLDIATKDIAYDPLSRRIYASIPTNSPVKQNTLTIIDPFNARIESAIYVGNNPGQIAVSERGKYVWIVVDDANIRRYDIQAKKTGPMFYLGERIGTEEIHPVPGNPEALLAIRVSRAYSPRFGGMIILENGVAREVGGGGLSFAWGTYGNRAYGYDNDNSGFAFWVMKLTPKGLEVVSDGGEVISGYNKRIRSENGLVFVEGSQVVEPETRTTLGSFSPSSNIYVPDSSVGRMYFAFGEKGQVRIVACDLSTFGQVDSILVPGVKGSPTKLIRWGENGLAFSTSEGQLVLLRTSLIPARLPLVDLRVQRSSVTMPLKTGQPVNYTLMVSNTGTNKATGVFLTDRLPKEMDVLDIKSSQGEVTALSGIVRANLGDIAPQKTVTVNVSFQSRKEVADDFNPVAIVRSLQPDKTPNNNTTAASVGSRIGQTTPPQIDPQNSSLARPVTAPASPPSVNPAAPPTSGPDLTGSWKEVEQNITGTGVELQATLQGVFIVRNAGNKPTAVCKVRFLLTNSSAPGMDEELLQESSVPALASGKTAVVRLKARLKPGQSALGQVVTAILDPAKKIMDTNRENNRVPSKPIP